MGALDAVSHFSHFPPPLKRYTNNMTTGPTFPGPTIVAKKDCYNLVRFHNRLGTDRHMFEIDRSVFCGTEELTTEECDKIKHKPGYIPPPDGEDEDFYCRCVSQRGSERRATVQ